MASRSVAEGDAAGVAEGLGLGLAVGAAAWLWPKRSVPPATAWRVVRSG